MIYKVTIRQEGDWLQHVIVEADNFEEVLIKVKAEYPNHTIVSLGEEYAIAIIR